MLETALKLSDSRLLLFGAVAIDTACMGTLAALLATPSLALGQSGSNLLLVSLALTGPVLALSIGGCTQIISKDLPSEERARRAILAGTVLHLGVQAAALLTMLCNCSGPTTLRAYVLNSALWIGGLLIAMGLVALLLKYKRSGEKALSMKSDALPPSKL